MERDNAIIGIADHGGWAIFVTAAAGGAVLDRRRVELVAPDLPPIPHHTECQRLPLPEAVALVQRVQRSAEHHAALALEAVAAALPGQVTGVALRHCPTLPTTIEERITNYHAQNNADWVMYRQALAAAAAARAWSVHWYDAKTVAKGISPHLLERRATLGPPWTADHRTALAAALKIRDSHLNYR